MRYYTAIDIYSDPRINFRLPDAYVGMELAVVPVFQSEIVPKQVRGIIVETYQLMLYVSITNNLNVLEGQFSTNKVLFL